MSLQSNATPELQTPAPAKANGKKRYKAPHLNSFGMITNLTAGGSTGPNENSNPPPHPLPGRKG